MAIKINLMRGVKYLPVDTPLSHKGVQKFEEKNPSTRHT